MSALISHEELTRYRATRVHAFAHDFVAEPITLIQSVLLAAFHEWQGNQANIKVSAPAERLALVVSRMRVTPVLSHFAKKLPMGVRVERRRGQEFRFDDWKACFNDKRREQLLSPGSEPALTADGLRIGDDVVTGNLAPGRYGPDVIDLFGVESRRKSFMAILSEHAPERMSFRVVDETLNRIIRRAIR